MIALVRLRPSDDPSDAEGGQPTFPDRPSAEHEDLAYKVELWNEAKTGVESVLAVTVSASIGYAAFYAATREFPERYITLRHKNSILTRWGGRSH
jgi:hypothetical protein